MYPSKYFQLQQILEKNRFNCCVKAVEIGANLSLNNKASDRDIEAEIRGYVLSYFSEDIFIGEEQYQLSKFPETKNVNVWYCDPVDDTTSRNIGAPYYAVQLSSVRDGIPNASCVIAPKLRMKYFAYENVTPKRHDLHLLGDRDNFHKFNQNKEIKDATISLGGLYNGDDVAFVLAKKKIGKNRVAYNNWMGFAALCSGYVDVMIETSIRIWDWMPWYHFINNLGGIVTNYAGNKPKDKDSIIASINPNIHNEVLHNVWV